MAEQLQHGSGTVLLIQEVVMTRLEQEYFPVEDLAQVQEPALFLIQITLPVW